MPRRSCSVDIGLANGLPLIDEHDIFRMDRHRGTREDQTSAEAHLHTEHLAIDGDSTSQPAPNARPVMRAKPLGRSNAATRSVSRAHTVSMDLIFETRSTAASSGHTQRNPAAQRGG